MSILWQRQYETGQESKYRFDIINDVYNVSRFKANTQINAIHYLLRLN